MQTKPLWSEFQDLLNSEIFLLQNTPKTVFFGFPDNKENFEIINHLHFIFKCYLFNSRDTRKTKKEGLKKNTIKIYNIEKQIYSNNSKKETKFKKKYHILENLLKFTSKVAWVGIGKVNMPI